MEFSAFLKIIPNISRTHLPGEISQHKMAPPERAEVLRKNNRPASAKLAAVLALIYPKDNISTLALIVRNTYRGVHSNQIGFPGGKPETHDRDLLATALRECHEEVGVHSKRITPIISLTPIYIPPSNFMVSTYLAHTTETPTFVLDPREVVELIELPLATLLNDQNVKSILMETSYSKSIEVPVFSFGKYNIWGATAMILSELKDIINCAK